MMGKKSDENWRALALNETVGENCFFGENYSPTSIVVKRYVTGVWTPIIGPGKRGDGMTAFTQR
jgi:hypothetical protein